MKLRLRASSSSRHAGDDDRSFDTTPSSSSSKHRRASSSSNPATPLKPILRTSASYHHHAKEGNTPNSPSASHAHHRRNTSSTSSTGSQKQLAFLLPGETVLHLPAESNTSGSSTSTPTATPASSSSSSARQQHARDNSTTSSFSSKSPDVSPTNSTSDRPRRQLKKKTRPSATTVALPAIEAGKSLHIRSASLPETQQQNTHVMPMMKEVVHERSGVQQRVNDKRASFDSMFKDLPPLPLNASAPPSSTSSSTISSLPTSNSTSRHRRYESASSATSSVPSTNPIHLPRLKFGQPTGRLSFPEELLSPALDSPSTVQCHKAAASMSMSDGGADQQRFSWLGMTASNAAANPKTSKRDSADSKRSSGGRRRSADPSSVAMQAGNSSGSGSHRRTRSSQLDSVPEFTMLGQEPPYTVSGGRRRSTKLLYTQEIPDYENENGEDKDHAMPSDMAQQASLPSARRRADSDSKRDALKMTQLWVAMLEDFVLLCDDASYPSSARSSVSSASSSYVVPLSPAAPDSITFSNLDKESPGSPAPSSECDPPFLGSILPRSSRAKVSPPTLTKINMPSQSQPALDIDDSAGSTTNTYSPLSSSLVISTPASSTGSIAGGGTITNKARSSYNPFEASFAACTPPATSESKASTSSSTSHATAGTTSGRRASLPGNLPLAAQNYSISRPGKQRPPPLQLASIPDTDESLHTAVPPQTEAQTRLFTSQRSRSLPTEELQPCSYSMRQPVSPKQKKIAEQLANSTSSTGSNRSSVRYHFPSSQFQFETQDQHQQQQRQRQDIASDFLEASTRKRNKSLDEGYSGTGLTPTPTSDTFSIPLRSREYSLSSASVMSTAPPPELTSSSVSRSSSAFTSDSSSIPSPRSAASFSSSQSRSLSQSQRREDKTVMTTPEHTPLPDALGNSLDSVQVTPTATRTASATAYSSARPVARSRRSQSASEHVRKHSNEPTAMKRSPTLEIVMYGVAM